MFENIKFTFSNSVFFFFIKKYFKNHYTKNIYSFYILSEFEYLEHRYYTVFIIENT